MANRYPATSLEPYDIIIPARNEAATIAEVVAAALQAPGLGRVVVIDDHSSDRTRICAEEAGAEVRMSRGHMSKALALATGVAETSAAVVVFFDGDIRNVHPSHFSSLAQPVSSGEFAMCCGIVDYGALRNPIFLRLPPITGLRAVRRDVFTAIPPSRLNGFQIEIMINEVVARAGMPSAITVLRRTGHRSKVQKLGVAAGLKAHLAMTAELLHCFTFVPLWTYGSYLRNLTILPSTDPTSARR